MKRISLVVSILGGSFVSVAWGQQPAGKCTNDWSEFHWTNMQHWNPCETCLASQMQWNRYVFPLISSSQSR
jgi:hypothetical protein